MDAVVSTLLDSVVSQVSREIRLVSGVGKEIEKLTSNLQSIQAVLIAAEGRQHRDRPFQIWLEKLKRVTCEIDDLLDEWLYQASRSQSDKRKRKVWLFNLRSVCFCFPVVALRRRFAVKISELNARLELVASGKPEHALLLLRGVHERVERPLTDSVIDIREVKGREVEKARLVNSLLAESSEMLPLHLVSIVGMAGIGKTTLAKLVYNDEMVKSHFSRRIWVCVSEPFDGTRIAEKILESLIAQTSNYTPNLVESQSLLVKVRQFIKGQKLLLALDDVWNEDPSNWKELEEYLLCGASGSTILLTTRNENVAKLMGCVEGDIFRVGLLSAEECWSMFCDIAFYCQSSEQRRNLEAVGAEIAARCRGLPLAVKTLAGLLRFKFSKQEWESVLGSELWMLEKAKRDILDQLWSSYRDMSSSLRQCFLYCALFPKGFKMSKDELICLWMAHGFLKPTEDKDLEMVGLDYFHDLSMRFLFQDVEVEEKFNRLDKIYCQMHDVVHDFAKYMIGKDCLYLDMNSAEQVASRLDVEQSDYLYHLFVKLGERGEFLDSFHNLGKLRSLVILPPHNFSSIGADLPKLFSELTSLRSLSLSRCRLENIPSNINRLIHLRWLKLSKNYGLKELPETICELHNLQTLSVNWCNGLVNLPKGVEKLVNLRHLKNDYTYFLLPKGIGKLSGLQKLPRIMIDPKFKDVFTLRDLENLNNICGPLTIFFVGRELQTLVKDATIAQLEEKKHITALSLSFPEMAEEEWMQQDDEELVEALKLSPSLEMLRITSYMGRNCPSWLNTLTSLKKLKLWYWSNCEYLPALAKLPCLECVEFNHFGRLKKVTAEFYRIDGVMEASLSTSPLFPKLKNLQFMNMTEWEEWCDYDGDEEVMPSLSCLSIENCPKLKAFPNFIQEKASLQKHIS